VFGLKHRNVVFWAFARSIVGKPTIVSQAENSFSETPASACAGNFRFLVFVESELSQKLISTPAI
jgi:hypothetical protein